MLPEFAYSLYQRFEKEGIPILLAGGWAVCHHGYSRLTLDIDWVCSRSNEEKAIALMETLGFIKTTDGMASRFQRVNDLTFPFIDLIWVDDASFTKMAERDPTNQDSRIPVINFRALLAMKLFALKDSETREGKDLLDIRFLLRYGPNKVSEEELKAMCDRFAGPDAYHKVRSIP